MRWVRALLAGTQGTTSTFNGGHRQAGCLTSPRPAHRAAPSARRCTSAAAQPLAARCSAATAERAGSPASACRAASGQRLLPSSTQTTPRHPRCQQPRMWVSYRSKRWRRSVQRSAAKLNVGKSKGMGRGPPQACAWPAHATGIVFVDTAGRAHQGTWESLLVQDPACEVARRSAL
jgi:hypothetical protein